MDPTTRFSNRVQDYIAYRPRYPEEIIPYLSRAAGLTSASEVADVGSGTGIWTALLLTAGCRVYAVEPNAPMREAAVEALSGYGTFRSIDGSAEDTRLAGQSVDLITAAQAFHWFDRDKARREFARILRPEGLVVLLWNDRRTDSTPFLREYDSILRELGSDYERVNHRNIQSGQFAEFFGATGYSVQDFPNVQRFDWNGLYGRAMSSSYVPSPDHPRHAAFTEALRACFQRHARDGMVQFDYDTRVYIGRVG